VNDGDSSRSESGRSRHRRRQRPDHLVSSKQGVDRIGNDEDGLVGVQRIRDGGAGVHETVLDHVGMLAVGDVDVVFAEDAGEDERSLGARLVALGHLLVEASGVTRVREPLGEAAFAGAIASTLGQFGGDDESAPLTKAEVKELVKGGVEGLRKEHIDVQLKETNKDLVADAEEADTASVGPVTVAKRSKTMLQTVIGVMGAIIVLLGAGIVFLLWRRMSGND